MISCRVVGQQRIVLHLNLDHVFSRDHYHADIPNRCAPLWCEPGFVCVSQDDVLAGINTDKNSAERAAIGYMNDTSAADKVFDDRLYRFRRRVLHRRTHLVVRASDRDGETTTLWSCISIGGMFQLASLVTETQFREKIANELPCGKSAG